MDEEQKRKLLQEHLDARSKAMMGINAEKQTEQYMPMIEGAAGMSAGLANVAKPAVGKLLRGIVNMTEPKVDESGIISPLAEKFSGLRRYIQELGGTGAQSPESMELQRMIKAKDAAKRVMDEQDLREFTARNKPSDEEIALSRFKMDQQAEELANKKLKNLEKTFNLSSDRRK